MAKVKSIKCYNFVMLSGMNYITFNMQFYDLKGELIILDFSNPLSTPTETYCETSEYIVTAKGNTYAGGYPHEAFHTANTNNTLGLTPLASRTWRLDDGQPNNDWIKIEFKVPLKLSDIKILNSYFGPAYGFDTCNYDVEYADGEIETGHYKSDGLVLSIPWQVEYQNRDQNIVDAKFDSIDFNKTISIYDTKIGYVETLDTNNFRNIPVDKFEKLKVLHTNPTDTYLNCLISFDKKQTWKTFDGLSWNTISDISPQNIISNGMEVSGLNSLDKKKLIAGGFTGDLDFKIAMKTNNKTITSSVTKIYIEYK